MPQPDSDRAWIDTGLVFTTRHGTPIEPRNFNRSFDRGITRTKVLKITVHGTRKPAARCCNPRVEDLQSHSHQQIQSICQDLDQSAPAINKP